MMQRYLQRFREHPGPALREMLGVARFALVGIAATGVHLSVASFLAFIFSMNLLAANVIAFLTAFIFSFSGNFYWTFPKMGVERRTALRRFLVVAIFAFAANSLLLAWLLQKNFISEGRALLIAVLVVPIATFTGARLWAFRG